MKQNKLYLEKRNEAIKQLSNIIGTIVKQSVIQYGQLGLTYGVSFLDGINKRIADKSMQAVKNGCFENGYIIKIQKYKKYDGFSVYENFNIKIYTDDYYRILSDETLTGISETISKIEKSSNN